MGNILYRNDRMIICPKYKDPKEHKHLAKHIIISTKEMKCILGGEKVTSKSIIIQSNINHLIKRVMDSKTLVFLIDDTSDLAIFIDDIYLQEDSFSKLGANLEDDIINYIKNESRLSLIDDYIMRRLGYKGIEHTFYDERIVVALDYIENSENIESEIYDVLAKKLCLSKSRFLHLFKEEMGVDLRSYLLIKKLEKTCTNVIKNQTSITEAALETGFSSSSHFADACLRTFGISLSEFLKSQQIAF